MQDRPAVLFNGAGQASSNTRQSDAFLAGWQCQGRLAQWTIRCWLEAEDSPEQTKWTHRGLSRGPPACYAGVTTLLHVSHVASEPPRFRPKLGRLHCSPRFVAAACNLHAHLRANLCPPMGFEPKWGEPIGLAGRRLNHSAKASQPQTQRQPRNTFQHGLNC